MIIFKRVLKLLSGHEYALKESWGNNSGTMKAIFVSHDLFFITVKCHDYFFKGYVSYRVDMNMH